MTKRGKPVVLGRNPRLRDLIAWAEQNGFRVEIEFRDKRPAKQAAAPDRLPAAQNEDDSTKRGR
jgi:hypothetical protein